MTRPRWLTQKLENLGLPAGGRGCHPATCRTCGAIVLTGLDNDVAAFTVAADPGLIDEHGELRAALGGRPTFDLEHTRTRLQLTRRAPATIALGTRNRNVVAEHRCCGTVLTEPPRRVTPRGDTPQARGDLKWAAESGKGR